MAPTGSLREFIAFQETSRCRNARGAEEGTCRKIGRAPFYKDPKKLKNGHFLGINSDTDPKKYPLENEKTPGNVSTTPFSDGFFVLKLAKNA